MHTYLHLLNCLASFLSFITLHSITHTTPGSPLEELDAKILISMSSSPHGRKRQCEREPNNEDPKKSCKGNVGAVIFIDEWEEERERPCFWNGPLENYYKDGKATRTVRMTYATCTQTDDETEVYGHGDASEKAALALLTETCTCGARWHYRIDSQN